MDHFSWKAQKIFNDLLNFNDLLESFLSLVLCLQHIIYNSNMQLGDLFVSASGLADGVMQLSSGYSPFCYI